jgi:hypothetical protein
MTLPGRSDFLGGPSDLNDIACDLLRKRPVPEGRRRWLALEVLTNMVRLEALHLGGEPPVVPAHDMESFTDRPLGWWKAE